MTLSTPKDSSRSGSLRRPDPEVHPFPKCTLDSVADTS
jgi:hypothetical protein